jgi:hypothetical protein
MSVHTYVEVGVEISEKIKKYQDIETACIEASVKVPEEVSDFLASLEDEGNIEDGIYWTTPNKKFVKNISRDGQYILEIDLTKLPSEIKHIRFVNSY